MPFAASCSENVGGEGNILLAADHLPRAGGVALDARADIVDDQRIGVLTVFCRIGVGIPFQNFEAGREARIVRNLGKYGARPLCRPTPAQLPVQARPA